MKPEAQSPDEDPRKDSGLPDLGEDPALHFGRPAAVLEHGEHSRDEKVRILEAWRFDEERVAAAQSEGMSGPSSRLQEIMSALATLG